MHPDARRLIPALLLASIGSRASAQEAPPAPAELPAAQVQALDRITPDSLRGHLSFLASDLLEGRDTPSKGLDLAAEYIAAQFRRAGLEAVGDDGYFQTARWELAEPDVTSFRMDVFSAPDAVFRVDKGSVSLVRAGAINLDATGVFKADFKTDLDIPADQLAGRVVLVEGPDLRQLDAPARRPVQMALNAFRAKLTTAKAAWLVVVSREADDATGLGAGRLIDPVNPEASERVTTPGGLNASVIGTITVQDPRFATLFDGLRLGPSPMTTVALHLGEPTRRPVSLRNVVGLLRGSDPTLSETVVMVTAHYDHIGVRGPSSTPDRIYNGANDDGSGTVSVIELASALAALKPADRPKRSILFATFFGEEHGLLGSRYYGRHPIIPVNKTVADLNLEQVGRTDSSEGPQVNTASLTGFGFSEVSSILVRAGALEGIKVYRHPQNSDAYFGASDNQALADLGVPAHTLCVAYQYADYHGAADHWDKLDYPNMARVDRVVARALLTIADTPAEPRWDEVNPKAAKYRKAWADRHPQPDPAQP